MTTPGSSLEFIGALGTQRSRPVEQSPTADRSFFTHSEAAVPVGPLINKDYIAEIAKIHEDAGFDRVLVAHSSTMPDGPLLAAQALEATTRAGVLLAHRPGFTAPTIVARMYATLENLYPGRVAMHVISGGDDADQARDGDWTDKATRYRRSADFLEVVRKEWTEEKPFDHEGEFYKIKDAFTPVKPTAPIPVYFGGASEYAIPVGAKHADAYAFWGEPLDGIRQRIAEVRTAAAPYGRDLRFSVSLRPIVADTEEKAWKRAESILEATKETIAHQQVGRSSKEFGRSAEGSQRLLAAAEKGDVLDKRLWTAIAKTTGAAGNSTALVGSYEQVADALLDYVDLGVTTLLIRGFDPAGDAKKYGRVIELVRAGAERRPAIAV